ncbi:MAG: ATP-binding cassette domain-containing protein, partial [Gammaproteobacteria bacterium]
MSSRTVPEAPLLQIRNLGVRFTAAAQQAAAQHAVASVDLEVAAGEVVGLVGESGSGKSVTAMSIPHLLPPQARLAPESEVRFAGEQILSLPERRVRELRTHRMGMIFQEPMTALHPTYSIGAQLMEAIRFRQYAHLPARERVFPGRSLRAQLRKEAVAWLDRVGIPSASYKLDAYPDQMSGGQRQRVLIAMALTGEPELLIADEPTTALDVTVQMQILELLQELQVSYGLAVLFISHDLGVV